MPPPPSQPSQAARTDDLPYLVAFSRVPGIGPRRLTGLVEAFGSAARAWAAPPRAMAGVLDERSLEAFREARPHIDPDGELRAVEAAGAKAIALSDPAYPPQLRPVDRAPFVLFVRGDPAVLALRSLAIVGTRNASGYGIRAACELSRELAAAGLVIVSGAASGVDTAAHQSALTVGGLTVAVLGCGVDVCYPYRNRRLLTEIADRGALVSELPVGTQPLPAHFPARNRIVSGLSQATLVVEAGNKSGALITADFALAQGRDVFAVPGEIFRPQAVGTNRLLAAGAGLAGSAADLLLALHMERVDSQNELRHRAPADPVEAAVMAALQPGAMDTDTLARELDMPVALLARSLTLMELKGLVQAGAGQRWVPMG